MKCPDFNEGQFREALTHLLEEAQAAKVSVHVKYGNVAVGYSTRLRNEYTGKFYVQYNSPAFRMPRRYKTAEEAVAEMEERL